MTAAIRWAAVACAVVGLEPAVVRLEWPVASPQAAPQSGRRPFENLRVPSRVEGRELQGVLSPSRDAIRDPQSAVRDSQSPELRILSPGDEAYVSGPTLLRAQVVPPDAVAGVTSSSTAGRRAR
jgi:hypothetical protein